MKEVIFNKSKEELDKPLTLGMLYEWAEGYFLPKLANALEARLALSVDRFAEKK